MTLITPAARQDGPVARITLPIMGQTLRGNITVQGTATSPQFARYTVSYATEPDLANWTVINGSLDPQPNGMLAVWNTQPLPDGKYALRLQVINSDNSQVEVMVRDITLANVPATSTTGLDTGAVVTSTTSSSVSGTGTLGIDPASIGNSLNLSDIPGAFVKGARYTLYAFAALAAYLLVKRFLGSLLRRVFRHGVDYGR